MPIIEISPQLPAGNSLKIINVASAFELSCVHFYLLTLQIKIKKVFMACSGLFFLKYFMLNFGLYLERARYLKAFSISDSETENNIFRTN